MSVDQSDVPVALREAVSAALAAAEVADGHLALELVDSARIRELNREHRGIDEPTDVLAFPVDEVGPVSGPRELGDVVICAEHSDDVREAAVHGVLHLCGYDHERDEGEMLALQARVMARMGEPMSEPGSEQWYREAWSVYTGRRLTIEDVRAGELDPIFRYYAPDIVCDLSGLGWPDAALFHGHEGIREIWDLWYGIFRELEWELLEIEVSGGRCLSLAHQRARGAGSGAEVEMTIGVVMVERDGQIAEIAMYADLAAARAAAAL